MKVRMRAALTLLGALLITLGVPVRGETRFVAGIGGGTALAAAPPAFPLAHGEPAGQASAAGGASDDDSEGGPPASGWGHFVWWVGHFHPAMTVFPIGLVLAAAVAEVFRKITGAVWLDGAARFCVIVAGVGAAITAPLGWAFAAGRGGSWVLETHRWLGTVGAVVSIVLLVLSERRFRHRDANSSPTTAFRATLFVAAPLVMATGFFGG